VVWKRKKNVKGIYYSESLSDLDSFDGSSYSVSRSFIWLDADCW